MTTGPVHGDAQASFINVLRARPASFIIGVAGDSGTGKTTFTASLRHLFGDTLVSTLSLDDYHLFDREQRKERNITPLVPEANDLPKLESDLSLLKSGNAVRKMVYNHEKGTLEGPVEFPPTPILIVEGLHSLFTEDLRELTDFSLYVDPDPDVKKEWKLKRDTGKRGYTERQAIEEMQKREQDYLRYIAPQKDHGDAVIRISFSKYGRDLGWQQNIYRMTLLQVPTTGFEEDQELITPLTPLFLLQSPPFSFGYSRQEQGKRAMSAMSLDGSFDRRFISGLAGSLRRDTGVDPTGIFQNSRLVAGEVIQVLLCWRVLRAILQRKREEHTVIDE
jgi:phosphoribulokinase